MPLQNRVTPWGEIVAFPERGLFMGNRGCLHDGDRHVVKPWARLAWVTCLLSFNGRHRALMTPGNYTELFFLDEATALAAGHRPCASCRREDYRRFKDTWVAANPERALRGNSDIASIDRLLHAERVDPAGQKRTWRARLGELPDGTLVAREGAREPLLVNSGALQPWTPGGYGPRQPASAQTPVWVLTPPSVVKAITKGYRPVLHASAAVSAPTRRETTTVPEPRAPLSPPKAPSAPSTSSGRLYRLERTPTGRALYAYFAAILSVTGMDKGAVYPLRKFLKNFSGHEQAGRIAKAPGGYRLTRSGMDYFADRYRPGNPQSISRGEVEAMVRLFRSGGAAGWVPVD